MPAAEPCDQGRNSRYTANDQRKVGGTIPIGSPDKTDPIHPHRFVLKHDVILRQKDQIDVAKSFPGKPGQDIRVFRSPSGHARRRRRGSRSLSGCPRPDASDPKR
ncbi:MAG: hypothetical protein MZU91_07030 [Desulfosudis oleivorans]|nr:hypothetical protein [Desulfosudis oleivorans]